MLLEECVSRESKCWKHVGKVLAIPGRGVGWGERDQVPLGTGFCVFGIWPCHFHFLQAGPEGVCDSGSGAQGENAYGYLPSPGLLLSSLLSLPPKPSLLSLPGSFCSPAQGFCSGSGFTFCRYKCLGLEVYSRHMVPCSGAGGFEGNELVGS